MSWKNGLEWPPQQCPKQPYLLISLGEVGFIYFIHSHDDGYHILPIHDGGSQDALGLIFCEIVHEVTEILVLKEGGAKHRETDEYKEQGASQRPC